MFPQLQGYPVDRCSLRTPRRRPKTRTGRSLSFLARLLTNDPGRG